MTRHDLLVAINKADNVYAWVNLTENDGQYIRIAKAALRPYITSDKVSYVAELRDCGDLYIN